MKFKKYGDKFIVRIDKGEEIVETLKKFCNEQNIKLGSIVGIGATNNVTIGLFKAKTKKYVKKTYTGDFEICPLVGNITTMNGEIYLHLHINLGDKNNKAYAGHLNKAIVSATCEIIIEKIDGTIEREYSDEIGLNLLGL